jgi:hypothetical protein
MKAGDYSSPAPSTESSAVSILESRFMLTAWNRFSECFVRQTVGVYLAVLGDAQAIVFGDGIGQNTPEVRSFVCGGLQQWGIELDGAQTTAHFAATRVFRRRTLLGKFGSPIPMKECSWHMNAFL